MYLILLIVTIIIIIIFDVDFIRHIDWYELELVLCIY